MRTLAILVSAMLLTSGVARAQQPLIIPEIGMPMERLAEITGIPIDKDRLRGRFGDRVNLLRYRTVITGFEFKVTASSLDDRVASYFFAVDDDTADTFDPCRFAFFAASRILSFTLGEADHPAPVPNPASTEFRTYTTYTQPDGSQGSVLGKLTRNSRGKDFCTVMASYANVEITAVRRIDADLIRSRYRSRR